MKTYILALLSVAIISGVIEILTPSGVSDGIKKHVRLLLSICVLCVVVYPVGSFIEELSSGDYDIFDEELYESDREDYLAVFEENLALHSADAISSGLERMICKKFSLSGEDIEIYVRFSGEDRVDKVALVLSGSGVMQDPRKLESYVGSLTGAEVEIIYDGT
jgi:hypothetical protein